LCGLLFSLGITADDYQQITVNGATVTKHVKKITFANDVVPIMHYDDGSVDSVFTETLNIILEVEEETAVRTVKVYGGVSIQGNTLTATGLNGHSATIYSIAGQKVLQQKTAPEQTTINIASLPKGIYILRSGDTAIKFERR